LPPSLLYTTSLSSLEHNELENEITDGIVFENRFLEFRFNPLKLRREVVLLFIA